MRSKKERLAVSQTVYAKTFRHWSFGSSSQGQRYHLRQNKVHRFPRWWACSWSVPAMLQAFHLLVPACTKDHKPVTVPQLNEPVSTGEFSRVRLTWSLGFVEFLLAWIKALDNGHSDFVFAFQWESEFWEPFGNVGTNINVLGTFRTKLFPFLCN